MQSKFAFKNLVKQCIAEVITEKSPQDPSCEKCGAKWSMGHKCFSEFGKLVKECVIEVLKENLTNNIWNEKKLSVGSKIKDIYGNYGTVKSNYVDGEHLTIHWDNGKISDVHYSWIKPMEMEEGFDPLSQGPNEPQENPYPAWNAKMRKLEEDDEVSRPTGETNVDHPIDPYPVKENEHCRYAQEAGAGQFDPRNFKVNSH